jgi:hypothetical protein
MSKKAREVKVVSIVYEVALTSAEFKRLLKLDHHKVVIPAMKGTEIEDYSVDYSSSFPNTVCFSSSTGEYPTKAIAVIESLVAKPKKTKGE